MEKFSQTLKELRKLKGVTQAQLANQLNVTDTAVRDWENRGREPSFEMLCKIAQIFEVTVGQLLGTEDY